jgi:hypothetical protein
LETSRFRSLLYSSLTPRTFAAQRLLYAQVPSVILERTSTHQAFGSVGFRDW